MLQEECGVFARDNWDMECIPELKMYIQLKDNIQRTHNAIPQHLYHEVRKPHSGFTKPRVDPEIILTLFFTSYVCQKKR